MYIHVHVHVHLYIHVHVHVRAGFLLEGGGWTKALLKTEKDKDKITYLNFSH